MRRLALLTGVAFVVGVVGDALTGAGIPGFIAAFSFFGCIVIIVASKRLGKALLQRREDYYEGGADA